MSVWLSRSLKVLGLVGLCLVSGVVGGALNRHFGTSSYTISFADFVSIMLMASTLVVTTLAVVLAVLGFVGWSTIENRVHTKTNEYLSENFKEGKSLYIMLRQRATEAMYEGVSPLPAEERDSNIPKELQ